ncbi:polysaccharide deacetylase family sporulation protein PdaB [Salipaludibacillus agaradhaerens]|uniref:polysaccharide deacetylase family sporulation protein PdaB n=1 Tax=Salipaludibacillus agaradhaerens TaxID=76935 RepID=UPI000997A341|nr:polysaccharide deacetylase family sporulation protein PdaB [Salipaludibacillus agaradhaerens]MCR6104930.1 polysaccharide deacetylase family sporulation protein PdaB [Salipaludibacillus agaradhaerens]MCR6116977.1 polysaccharide deacetylase family sporulation protein PdaB [Salipaludibacillus agaradhaerens]UJW56173.1 polysaccharide deacetylase family sporulation protein PdaB [Bacillus sp. A116_S68]
MNFIWIWRAKSLKRFMIISIAAFFTAGILYVESPLLPVFSTGDKPVAIHRVEAERPDLALTFDISWGEEQLEPILAVLKEEKVEEATFFVSGAWAERHPDLLEKIDEAGYEIGSHGYRHEHYTLWEEEDVKKDIQRAHNAISELTEEQPKYLRPPNGSFDDRILEVAEDLNYDVIHWSIHTHDWENPGVDTIVANATTNVENGDIILFHASDSAKQTVEALPIVLEKLKKDGFSFVSISHLLSGASVDAKEID